MDDSTNTNGFEPRETQAPAPPPAEKPVNSYTPTLYDGYAPLSPGGPPPRPVTPPPKKNKKTVSLSAALCTSAAVALLCSVLVFVIMMYGMNIGDQLNSRINQPVETTESDPASAAPITNIVVDTTAQTSAEAVADKVGPSVVGIQVTTQVNYYFYSTSYPEQGSGIVYTADGYIITNYHVVKNAVESDGALSVYLPNDEETAISATVVGYDVSADLAVIKVEKTGLTPIEIGDSQAVKVGQTAIAIGSPGGLDFMGSVSMGIISGLDRTLQLENSATEINLIQTDAAINPGNSGGALVDIQGRLIGINSAKMASSQFEGMGFAIPVNDAVAIVDRIIRNVDAPQPYLGVEISTYYDADTLQRMGYPAGVVIAGVSEGSPAAEAGLQRGDIITAFHGAAVTTYPQFNSEKAKYTPGQTVELTVYRRGQSYTVSITLGTANR